LRKLLLTLSIIVLCSIAEAQPAYNYSKFDFGIAGAVNKPFTDEQSTDYKPSGLISLTYNQTPFINYVGELQVGELTGKSNYSDINKRDFSTKFATASLRGQLQAGQLLHYYNNRFLNAMKNLYISSGVGAMYTRANVNSIVLRNNTYQTANGRSSDYAVYIPARLGYEFKIFNYDKEPFIKIDIGYQFNYIFGDSLDGYKSGNSNDLFSQFSVGIKFAVPGIATYKRPI
jgi:hypothetical protein